VIAGWRGTDVRTILLRSDPAFGEQRREGAGGADFSPDGRTVYWSSPGGGAVRVFDVPTGQAAAEIPLDSVVGGQRYHGSFVVELETSADGRHLFAADANNRRVATIDLGTGQVVGSLAVGRCAPSMALSAGRLYGADLGTPGAPESVSVWGLDIAQPERVTLSQQWHLGVLLGGIGESAALPAAETRRSSRRRRRPCSWSTAATTC